MNDKKVSAAVIIYDPVTQEIFAEHPYGRPWKNNDGTPQTGVFSLPKGIIEEGEDKVDAAIREIKEETDIDLNISRLHYLGKYEYTREKDLEMFFYPVKENEIKIESCKCNSFFDGPKGQKCPEVNGYCWLTLSNLHYFFYSQQVLLKKIFQDFKEFFI